MRYLVFFRVFLFCVPALSLRAEYLWDSESYAQSSSAQKAWIIEAMWAYRFEGDERVIDFGSGDGAITSLLAEKAPFGTVLGIDSSLSMIDYAKSHWKRENLAFELLDMESIQFKGQFDLATLFFTFEWIQDKQRAIRNCHQALVPGGRVWIVTPIDMPSELKAAAASATADPKWQPFFENLPLPATYLSIKDTYTLLLNNNLFSIYMRSRKKEILFASRDLFHKSLRAANPHLGPLPLSLKDSFVSDLVDHYLALRPPDRFGRISCTLEILEIIAMKRGG